MSLFSNIWEKKYLDSEFSYSLKFTVGEALHTSLILRPWGSKGSREFLVDLLREAGVLLTEKVDRDTSPQAASLRMLS